VTDPALDAETDQLMAALRDRLAGIPDGGLVPRAVANPLREQFPGVPQLGRILVCASQALGSLAGIGAGQDAAFTVDSLLAALAFAGAVIDQEDKAGG
jgi:hypothetical protein